HHVDLGDLVGRVHYLEDLPGNRQAHTFGCSDVGDRNGCVSAGLRGVLPLRQYRDQGRGQPRYQVRSGAEDSVMPVTRYAHNLLDLDPELAGRLEAPVRLHARPAATAVTFALEPRQLQLRRWLQAAGEGPGLLVLSGTLVAYARVADRVVAELLGRGDLLQAERKEAEFVGCDYSWRVLERARLAILDAAFAERIKPWPQITQALFRRAERRLHHLAVQRAIAAHPRLEVRLALLLWHLAARWGKREPGGVRLPLPLTHQLLGRL